MANKVLLKKSSTAAKVPLVGDLDYGELALNYTDGKLYYKTASNTIDLLASITATATLTNKTLTTPVVDRIDWAASGTGAPTTTTRSAGTKLTLYPALGASYVDYAIGIDSGTLWSSLPANDAGQYFKWYGGTTQVASLSGTGNLTASGNITATGDVLGQYLRSTNSTGDEGGEILLYKPATNSTIAGTGVTIDVYQNKLRIFEQGGSARGVYIDITAATAGVGTNLLTGSGGGTTTYALTIGTGLSGTSFNGSAAVTIAIDSTVTTLTGSQTLTNKSLTSPALTGTPTAPTAAAGTSTTQVATTAFAVTEALNKAVAMAIALG
jgi:hypothetical protein